MVLSIEAKQISAEHWEVYTNNGRERTGLEVVEWAKKAVSLGAGEILLTSVDYEGTRKGFDINLVKLVSAEINIPIIASGGMGKPEDLISVINETEVDAIAMADILHYKRAKIPDIRIVAENAGLGVRYYQSA